MSALVLVHILAGTIAIISGFTAPFARKGQKIHRVLGLAFLVSILALGLSGAVVAWVREVPLSFLNGLLIGYFVVTSFSVIKQRPGSISLVDQSMAVIAALLTGGYVYYALQAADAPDGELAGFGSLAYVAFGMVALICALSDVRLLFKRGLAGRQRIVRHLWRMFFPLFMSTAAFFLGQAKLFPEPLQKIQLLLLPVAFVLLSMLIWIVVVGMGRRFLSDQVRY